MPVRTRAQARAEEQAKQEKKRNRHVTFKEEVVIMGEDKPGSDLETGKSPALSSQPDSFFNFLPSLTPANLVRANQYYNFLVAAGVLVGYLTDPEASFAEYGFDIGVHVLSGLASEHLGKDFAQIAAGANVARLLAIGGHAALGNSTIPARLQVADVANHVFNLLSEGVAMRYARL